MIIIIITKNAFGESLVAGLAMLVVLGLLIFGVCTAGLNAWVDIFADPKNKYGSKAIVAGIILVISLIIGVLFHFIVNLRYDIIDIGFLIQTVTVMVGWYIASAYLGEPQSITDIGKVLLVSMCMVFVPSVASGLTVFAIKKIRGDI